MVMTTDESVVKLANIIEQTHKLIEYLSCNNGYHESMEVVKILGLDDHFYIYGVLVGADILDVNDVQDKTFLKLKSHKSSNITTDRGVQAGNSRLCGSIELDLKNKTKAINCSHCQEQYSLNDWHVYSKHVDDDHYDVINALKAIERSDPKTSVMCFIDAKTSKPTEIAVQTVDDLIEMVNDDALLSTDTESETETTQYTSTSGTIENSIEENTKSIAAKFTQFLTIPPEQSIILSSSLPSLSTSDTERKGNSIHKNRRAGMALNKTPMYDPIKYNSQAMRLKCDRKKPITPEVYAAVSSKVAIASVTRTTSDKFQRSAQSFHVGTAGGPVLNSNSSQSFEEEPIEFISIGKFDNPEVPTIIYTEYDTGEAPELLTYKDGTENTNVHEKQTSPKFQIIENIQITHAKVDDRTFESRKVEDANETEQTEMAFETLSDAESVENSSFPHVESQNSPKKENEVSNEDWVKNADANEENSDSYEDEMESNAADGKPTEIFFKRTKDEIIMEFLELFKARPVLWNSRRLAGEEYRCAVNEIVETLNAKWNLTFNWYSMEKSLMRIRHWYSKVLYSISKAPTPDSYRYKFRKYFEKCLEFLPVQNVKVPCEHCNALFYSEVSLQIHLCTKHQIADFKCEICNALFINSKALDAHKAKHITKKCSYCNETFIDLENYKVHRRSHVERNEALSRFCHICSMICDSIEELRKHKLTHTEPTFKCDACGKVFYIKSNLIRHRTYNCNKFTCEHCGKIVTGLARLREHIRGAHEHTIVCIICNSHFNSQIELQNHLKRNHFVLEGKVEDLQYITLTGFKKRSTAKDPVSNRRLYDCSECGRRFIMLATYKKHLADDHNIQKVQHPNKVVKERVKRLKERMTNRKWSRKQTTKTETEKKTDPEHHDSLETHTEDIAVHDFAEEIEVEDDGKETLDFFEDERDLDILDV